MMSDRKSLPTTNQQTTIPTENDWAWWNRLSDKWKFIFLENLKEDELIDFSKYFGCGTQRKMPNNLSISAVELKKILKIKKLNAKWAGLEDITPLLRLTQLTELNLGLNKISDISALGNLTQLTVLGLRNNQISDISALGNLTQLTMLDLNNNQISDISALGNLTQLIQCGLLQGNPIPKTQLDWLKQQLPNTIWS